MHRRRGHRARASAAPGVRQRVPWRGPGTWASRIWQLTTRSPYSTALPGGRALWTLGCGLRSYRQLLGPLVVAVAVVGLHARTTRTPHAAPRTTAAGAAGDRKPQIPRRPQTTNHKPQTSPLITHSKQAHSGAKLRLA
jgi:hypothetical protein